MAITTEDGLIAGLLEPWLYFKIATTAKQAGTLHAVGLQSSGIPAVFTPGSPGLGGATVDGTSSTLGGTMSFVNPGSGSTYLARFNASLGAAMTSIHWFDLLWYNTGIVSATTTAQTVTSVTLPSRDASGSTNGVGVTAWLYASVASSNAGAIANTTISYTNAAGTSSRTATLLQSWPITASAGTFMPFLLQGTDTGVRSIQSVTLGTSYGTGTVHLILARTIASFATPTASSSYTCEWSQTGFPVLYNGTALSFYVMPTGTALGQVSGDVTYAQG